MAVRRVDFSLPDSRKGVAMRDDPKRSGSPSSRSSRSCRSPAAFRGGSVAGSWPNQGGSANIVPVVANGKVYVASHKKLDIFSIKGENERLVVDRKIAPAAAIKPESPKGPEQHRLYGTVRKGQADQFTIETRDHKLVDVNSTKARAAESYALAAIGNGVSAAGSYDKKGVLQAESVHRVQRHRSTWLEDR